MVYAVYTTDCFEKEIEKISEFDRKIINKICVKLKENPYVGDAIRYNFFREKRIREKRIYFLIYEEFSIVLIVAFGGKKIQQETIDEIIHLLPEYKEYVQKISSNSSYFSIFYIL